MGDVNDTAVFNEIDPLNNSINEPSFPEGMLPSLVNDNSRALMGAVKRFRDWLCGGATVGGTNNAITLTFANNPYLLVKGDRYLFFPTAGNTGAVTLTIGSLPTKAVQRNGAALVGGELTGGIPVEVIYDGTAFQQMPFLTSFSQLGVGTTTPLSTLSVGGPGESNWRTYIRGLGTTSDNFGLVIDDSAGGHVLYTRDDGVITFGKYGAGALFTDIIGDVGVGILPVFYGGTGVSSSTGSGSNVLNTNPVLRQTTISASVQNALQLDNGSGGNTLKFSTAGTIDPSSPSVRSDGTNLVLNAKTNGGLYLNNDITGGNTYAVGNLAVGTSGIASNWRQLISGQGSTSATFSLVVENSSNAGTFFARDDGICFLPAYANGALFMNGGAINSGTLSVANGGTGVTTSTGTGSTVLSISPVLSNATQIGSAAGSATSPVASTTNLLLYKNNASNWSGIGSATDGTMYFVTGTSSPATKLVITPNSDIVYTPSGVFAAINNSSGNSSNLQLSVGDPGSGLSGNAGALNVYASNIQLMSLTPTEIITNVGIGIGVSTTHQLQLLSNDAFKPGGGTWSDSSDRRLKQNFVTDFSALEKINALKPTLFQWRNPELHGTKQGEQVGGFIAQDIIDVFPEFVGEETTDETEDGKAHTVTLPLKFFAYLVKSIQELSDKVDDLQKTKPA